MESFGSRLSRELEKAGFKIEPVDVMLDPEVVEQVNRFLREIEIQHQKAKESTIRFRWR